MACPNDTIKVTGEMVETEDGKKKKILAKYEYDLGSCIFCQLCVNACPHDAITFDQNFEHAVFRFYRLARHLDGVVGTSRLAQAAGHAMVFVLLVVGHCQRAAETFGEFQRLPVFRILFGSLLPPENGHGGFHARQQGSDTVYEATLNNNYNNERKRT